MKLDRRLLLVYAIAGLFPTMVTTIMDWARGELTAKGWDLVNEIMVSATLGVAITVSIASGVTYVLFWLQKRFPWSKNIWKRVFAEALLTTLAAQMAMFIWANLLYVTVFRGETYLKLVFTFQIIALIMNAILVTIYEGMYLFREWKKSLVKTEVLEKENILSRYETLKHQVNPHFLFNSLNVLSGLIHDDPDKAEEFVDDFSSVYRYVLEHRNEDLVSLRKELEFIRSFLFLQQIRFGDNLKSRIEVEAERLADFLPPLSLQLLVENAIKHNVVSKKRPLTIHISNDGDKLVVRNNLQPRENGVSSTGVGLENLRERYRIYPGKDPVFTLRENEYEARIPLLPLM